MMSEVHTVTEFETEYKSLNVKLKLSAQRDDAAQQNPPAMDTDTANTGNVAADNVGEFNCDDERKHRIILNNEVEKQDPSQPPKPALIKGANLLPCIQQKEMSQTTKSMKRNKNTIPGKGAISTSKGDSCISTYTEKAVASIVEDLKCDDESDHRGIQNNEFGIRYIEVQTNTTSIKRNKNATDGKTADSISTEHSNVSMLATRMSQLDIDGPEVPVLVSASGQAETTAVQATSSGSPESQTFSATSRGASGSSSSMASPPSIETEDETEDDDLEYGDECASSLPTSSSESSLLSKTGNGKYDFVILHTDEDIEDAFAYKNHLQIETKKLGIMDLKVQVFSAYGFGQSVEDSLESIPDHFHHTLVYVTANLCKDHYIKFLKGMLIRFNLEKGSNCKVTGIWATKEKQPINTLRYLPGLPYWRFKLNCLPEIYINAIKCIVAQIRNVQ